MNSYQKNKLTHDITESKLDLFMKIREVYSIETEKTRHVFVNKKNEINNFELVDQQFGVTYRYFLNKLIEINKIGMTISPISSRTILMFDNHAISEINFKTFLSQFTLKNEKVILSEKNYRKKVLTEMNNKLNAKMKILVYCMNRSKHKHSDTMQNAIEFVSLHLYNCILDV